MGESENGDSSHVKRSGILSNNSPSANQLQCMDEVDTCTEVAEGYAKYIHAKEKEIVLLTFLSVVCNMSQGVCCSSVIHTKTTIKYRSSFIS